MKRLFSKKCIHSHKTKQERINEIRQNKFQSQLNNNICTHKPKNRIVKVREVRIMQVQIEEIKPDYDFLNQVMLELGIDMNKKEKYQSKLPKNRLGLHVIRGAGRTMLEIYEEEHGKC